LVLTTHQHLAQANFPIEEFHAVFLAAPAADTADQLAVQSKLAAYAKQLQLFVFRMLPNKHQHDRTWSDQHDSTLIDPQAAHVPSLSDSALHLEVVDAAKAENAPKPAPAAHLPPLAHGAREAKDLDGTVLTQMQRWTQRPDVGKDIGGPVQEQQVNAKHKLPDDVEGALEQSINVNSFVIEAKQVAAIPTEQAAFVHKNKALMEYLLRVSCCTLTLF
jgi:hypothetical protein